MVNVQLVNTNKLPQLKHSASVQPCEKLNFQFYFVCRCRKEDKSLFSLFCLLSIHFFIYLKILCYISTVIFIYYALLLPSPKNIRIFFYSKLYSYILYSPRSPLTFNFPKAFPLFCYIFEFLLISNKIQSKPFCVGFRRHFPAGRKFKVQVQVRFCLLFLFICFN